MKLNVYYLKKISCYLKHNYIFRAHRPQAYDFFAKQIHPK